MHVCGISRGKADQDLKETHTCCKLTNTLLRAGAGPVQDRAQVTTLGRERAHSEHGQTNLLNDFALFLMVRIV